MELGASEAVKYADSILAAIKENGYRRKRSVG